MPNPQESLLSAVPGFPNESVRSTATKANFPLLGKKEEGEQRKMSPSGWHWALLLVLVILRSTATASSLLPDTVLPQDRPSPLQENQTLELHHQDSAKGNGNYCSYKISIKTSCSSPRFTRDAVSLAFGDTYRNEVYAPRLDDPSSDTFERCSTDTFKIQGPCAYKICYLYLRRSGRDGWIPRWVKVTGGYSSYVITFNYGTPLPNAVWYGFNLCPNSAATAGEG